MSVAVFLLVASVLGQSELTTGPIEYVGEGFTFTEGPLWLGEDAGWVFSETVLGGIYRSAGGMQREKEHFSNGLTLDNHGRLVACEFQTRSLVRIEADGSRKVLADAYQGKGFNGPNDVVAARDGRIFFTDPKPLRKDFDSPLGFSGVYTFDPKSGEISLLTDEMKYPNGILLSPDEKTLYVADTSGANVMSFPVKSDGSVGEGREFCKVRIPDGMAIDQAGRLWIASSRGISVFDAKGNALESIRVKPMPTNCAFGGPDGKTLFITARRVVAQISCAEAGIVAGPR